jgi:hypothetical protein
MRANIQTFCADSYSFLHDSVSLLACLRLGHITIKDFTTLHHIHFYPSKNSRKFFDKILVDCQSYIFGALSSSQITQISTRKQLKIQDQDVNQTCIMYPAS